LERAFKTDAQDRLLDYFSKRIDYIQNDLHMFVDDLFFKVSYDTGVVPKSCKVINVTKKRRSRSTVLYGIDVHSATCPLIVITNGET